MLQNIIDSKNKLKLLRELGLHENWEYSVNELSKNTGIHRVLISSLIKRLEEEKAIKIVNKGKTKLISINKDNYFVREILIGLFKKEKNLPAEIAKDFVSKIKNKDNIISVILYGSSVKGKFRFGSDIDLMIIIENDINKTEIENIINEFQRKGILILYDLMIIDELKRLYKNKEASIVTMAKDHKIVYGKELLEIL